MSRVNIVYYLWTTFYHRFHPAPCCMFNGGARGTPPTHTHAPPGVRKKSFGVADFGVSFRTPLALGIPIDLHWSFAG